MKVSLPALELRLLIGETSGGEDGCGLAFKIHHADSFIAMVVENAVDDSGFRSRNEPP